MSLATNALEVCYGERRVVEPLTTRVRAGEFVGLIGPNAAGKTSLLRALAGIQSTGDAVSWAGQSLAQLSRDQRARLIAYLPQSPRANWPLKVRELIELGRLPHRRFGQTLNGEDHASIDRALAETGIEHLADRPVNELSGGERVRTHLARAFAVDAPALLVDEPVASLDPYHQLHVMQLLDEYRASGRLVIAVLHDLNLALAHCSRLMLMDLGRIVADGPPDTVITEDILARHYSIRAWLTRRENRGVVVPWATLDGQQPGPDQS